MLCKRDTSDEEKKGGPLDAGEAAAEKEDSKEAGGEDFSIVEDLVGGGIEVGNGEVEDVVLKGVEEGRDGEFEEFRAGMEEVVSEEGSKGRRGVVGMKEEDKEGGDEFKELHPNDSRGRVVTGTSLNQ